MHPRVIPLAVGPFDFRVGAGPSPGGVRLFRFATRIDLDNYNRNAGEGIHTTSIAAAWMNIVYGFGGMRSDGEVLLFNPSIPPQWKGYSFQVTYRGSVIRAEVEQDKAAIRVVEGGPVKMKVGGLIRQVSREGISIAI